MLKRIPDLWMKQLLNWTWKHTPITFGDCLPGLLENYKFDDGKIDGLTWVHLTWVQSDFDVSLTADDVAKSLREFDSDHGRLRALDIMKVWLPSLSMEEVMTIRREMTFDLRSEVEKILASNLGNVASPVIAGAVGKINLFGIVHTRQDILNGQARGKTVVMNKDKYGNEYTLLIKSNGVLNITWTRDGQQIGGFNCTLDVNVTINNDGLVVNLSDSVTSL
jgi:hypothetical protein